MPSTVMLKTVRRESWKLKSSWGMEALKMGAKLKLDGSLGMVRMVIVVWKKGFRSCLQSNPFTFVKLHQRGVECWHHDSGRAIEL
jgi:hypothetical protein